MYPQPEQKRIAYLEKKIQTNDEVLAELMAEHDGPARVCLFAQTQKRDSISLFEVSGIFSYDNRQCTLKFDGQFGKLARGSSGKIWRASE